MTRRRHQRDPGTSHQPSQRQLRVAELVRHALADMLTRGAVHDPVVESHLITVPEVQMTADLQLATIYVVPLGGRDADDAEGRVTASAAERPSAAALAALLPR